MLPGETGKIPPENQKYSGTLSLGLVQSAEADSDHWMNFPGAIYVPPLRGCTRVKSRAGLAARSCSENERHGQNRAFWGKLMFYEG